MTLKHLKTEKCPHCGAGAISEKIGTKHSNGMWEEFREFRCGHIIKFSPNYDKEIEFRECSNSESSKLLRKNRKSACTKLWNYIHKLTVDDEFKRKLKREISFLKP